LLKLKVSSVTSINLPPKVVLLNSSKTSFRPLNSPMCFVI